MVSDRPTCPPRHLLLAAGGLGSRMKIVDASRPKELLPILGKPAIHYAVEEGIAAGLTHVVVVLSPEKEIIRRYFEDESFRASLFPEKASELTAAIEKCSINFVYQLTPSGEIDAIRLAEPLLNDVPFAVIYPDDVYYPFKTVLPSLWRIFIETGFNIIALSQVDSTNAVATGNTGRVTLSPIKAGLYEIKRFLPKETGSFVLTAPIQQRTCGFMIFQPKIFEYISQIHLPNGIEFTDIILRNHMLPHERFLGVSLPGRLYDIGNPVGYYHCINELSIHLNND